MPKNVLTAFEKSTLLSEFVEEQNDPVENAALKMNVKDDIEDQICDKNGIQGTSEDE